MVSVRPSLQPRGLTHPVPPPYIMAFLHLRWMHSYNIIQDQSDGEVEDQQAFTSIIANSQAED